MKILVSSDMIYPYVGGGETYVLNLGRQLARMGYEFHWCGTRMPGCKKEEIFEGIHLHRVMVPFAQKYLFSRYFYPLTSFFPLLKLSKKMDILQFNTYVGSLLGWLIGKLVKRPYCIFVHEFFREKWVFVGKNDVEKVVFPRIEEYIASSPYPLFLCPSEYTKKVLVKLGVEEKRIKVIPHGIEEIFKPSNPLYAKRFKGKFKIGWCGRIGLGYSKNLPCLLEAFRLVKEEIEETVLLLAGTHYEKLAPLVKEMKLKNVYYLGLLPREKLPNFYSSLDVFALSSLSEGFGFTALEAQACGTPVVCFSVGSLPEVVVDKQTGFVVKDLSPEALAEGIIRLYDEKLRRKMGEKGEKWARGFSWERSAKEHLKAYQQVINLFA